MSLPTVSAELLAELRLIYDKHDVDQTGNIDIRQLYQIMFDVGYALTEAELHEFMAAADVNNNFYIGFDQFLYMLTPKLQDMFSAENLSKAFAVFDRRKENYFNAHDLEIIMASMGEAIDEKDCIKLIADITGNAGHQVRLQEFLAYLLPD